MKKKLPLLITVFMAFAVTINAQTIPSYVPSNGLMGWWPFNNNANDESGSGNNGTLLNGVAATTDRFGNTNSAYSFDGVDDRIYINNSFFNSGWNQYTISAWVYLNAVSNPNSGNLNHIILNTSPHQSIGYGVNWGSSKKYYLFLGSGTPSSSWNALFNATSTQTAVPATWKFTTLTKNGNTFKFYVNGVLDNTWTSTTSIQSYFYKIYFGGTDPLTANEIINGKLDDIGIWNRELTPTEITDVYTSNNVGINELKTEIGFSMYPNPANGLIHIYTVSKTGQKAKLEVIDALGKILISENHANLDSATINIGQLSQGIYFIKLTSGEKTSIQKFIRE